MLLTAATTGAIPFLIQRTADDVFVAKNEQMVYWVTAAIVIVTIIKAIAEYVADVTVAYLGHRFIADLRIQMFARLARADLNWIQTVHSGRLLSSFLNDATLIRQTASRSLVTLGENYLKVIILIGTMFYMDARFAAMILIFMPFAWFLLGAPAAQDAEIDLQVAAGDRRPLGAHHPDLARHARGARLPAGGQGGGARRLHHQPRARIHHARHARARAVEPLDRASDRAAASRSPSISPAPRACAAISRLGHFMGFMTAALLIYAPLKSAATLQTQLQEGIAAASRVFGVDRPRVSLVEAARRQAARAQPRRDRVQQRVLRL